VYLYSVLSVESTEFSAGTSVSMKRNNNSISGVMKLAWRPVPPILRLQSTPGRPFSARWSSDKVCDPLRILFCGSDGFSVASLKAVHQELLERPDTIASIDVVCRPGKRAGRGLRNIREGSSFVIDMQCSRLTSIVPIKRVARDLMLPVHEIDTFTRWTVGSYI
jgi:hypothetical protein